VTVKWFGKSTNLHSVWDSAIIDKAGLTPDVFASDLLDAIGKITQRRFIDPVGRHARIVVHRHAFAMMPQ
jgi:hypothetical protein